MEWADLLGQASEFINSNWLKLLGTVLAGASGGVYMWCRNIREWKSRQFYGVFNVSFDTIHNGKLMTTALLEDKLEQAFSSLPSVVSIIKNAAKKTTIEDPFLRFSDKDKWHVGSQILVAIAETNRPTSWNFVAERPFSNQVDCYFAATYERFAGMKSGKIRVIVAPKWLLESDALDGKSTKLRTEYVHHADRIKTLRMMREDTRKEVPDFTRKIRIYTN